MHPAIRVKQYGINHVFARDGVFNCVWLTHLDLTKHFNKRLVSVVKALIAITFTMMISVNARSRINFDKL